MAESKITDRVSAVNPVVCEHLFSARSEDICVQNLLMLQALSQMAYRSTTNQPTWNELPMLAGFDHRYWLKINYLIESCMENYSPLTRNKQNNHINGLCLTKHLACLFSLLDNGLVILRPLVDHPSVQSWYNYVYTLWEMTQSIALAQQSKITSAH